MIPLRELTTLYGTLLPHETQNRREPSSRLTACSVDKRLWRKMGKGGTCKACDVNVFLKKILIEPALGTEKYGGHM